MRLQSTLHVAAALSAFVVQEKMAQSNYFFIVLLEQHVACGKNFIIN